MKEKGVCLPLKVGREAESIHFKVHVTHTISTSGVSGFAALLGKHHKSGGTNLRCGDRAAGCEVGLGAR